MCVLRTDLEERQGRAFPQRQNQEACNEGWLCWGIMQGRAYYSAGVWMTFLLHVALPFLLSCPFFVPPGELSPPSHHKKVHIHTAALPACQEAAGLKLCPSLFRLLSGAHHSCTLTFRSLTYRPDGRMDEWMDGGFPLSLCFSGEKNTEALDPCDPAEMSDM